LTGNNDLKTCGVIEDYQRGLRFSLQAVMPSGDKTQNRNDLERLRWRALTLWHEAGKPLPFRAHLGPFVLIEALRQAAA